MTQRHVPGRAARVHHSALVIDTHIDTLTHIVARSPDFSTVLSDGRVDIPRLRKGGVGAAYFAVWIDEGTPDTEALKYTLRSIEAMHEAVAVYSSDLEVALTGADITRIHAAGKVAVVITIEGGRVICDDLRVLGALQRLGVRSITLAWGAATTWMDSWNQEKHGGLTGFGRDVVRAMNDLGMVIDVSHASDKAFWQILEVSSQPVFASHSSCRALTPTMRNMTDEMIVAMAARGGVVNINFGAGFLTADPDRVHPRRFGPQQPEPRDLFDRVGWRSPEPGVPFERLIAHFEHAIKVAGADHVGIGSDFDGVKSVPDDMEDISMLPAITEALLGRGHSEADVRKVLGENNLRLMAAVTGA
ncbi:MAG: membrane dipeptidase [SAR202 cluster bacterium]|nr:membrane dipeptidase [SAR202 cluster bacterium]